MLDWKAFALTSPQIADAGQRLLALNEVAFLATVSRAGRPRIHPFVPRIVNDRFVAFIMDSSPKIHDLKRHKQCSIHTLPGDEDEEFFISGEALYCDTESSFREEAARAMGFVTGVDEHHILFEFVFDRALWTQWLDFGTPQHRPQYTRWKT
ncbi:MAG: pyridoxamine 5'-phosphate oxidase family protein [Pseudomonadota bacterium]